MAPKKSPKKKYIGPMRGNEGSASDKLYRSGKRVWDTMEEEARAFGRRIMRDNDMKNQGQFLKESERLDKKLGYTRKQARARGVRSAKQIYKGK